MSNCWMPEWQILILLCAVAFTAGFVDAIVGGGGLIQLPAGLSLLPQLPVGTVVGSLKIPAFTGTAFAVRQYTRRIAVNWKRVALLAALAFLASFTGSWCLSQMSNQMLKPIIAVVLLVVIVYTYFRKDFGQSKTKSLPPVREKYLSMAIAVGIGFYDGFIGPGAGSFFILAFIGLLGYDFLTAGTWAKLLNLSTNLGSIVLFLGKGSILWGVALPMALCNGMGGILGARFALLRGNRFIRYFFLVVVCATFLRYVYSIFN